MNTIALPIFIPLLLILILLVVRQSRAAQWISVAGSAILLVLSVFLLNELKTGKIFSLNMGGWEAPFGISLVLDVFSALMLVVSSLIMFALAIYSVYFMEGEHGSNRFYVFFFHCKLSPNGI